MKSFYIPFGAAIFVLATATLICTAPQRKRFPDKPIFRKGDVPQPKIVSLPKERQSLPLLTARANGRIFYSETLAEVQEKADAIIIGRPTTQFVNRTPFATYFQDGFIESAWIEGNLRVEQVLWKKANFQVAQGQTISLTEPVGLFPNSSGALVRNVVENCTEIKQNGTYVLFVFRDVYGKIRTYNFNAGRFNTNGIDPEDELGTVNGTVGGVKTIKQNLREELTAAYGVTFAPQPDPIIISSLNPDNVLAGSAGLTLTVGGRGFESGSFVSFDGRRTTNFVDTRALTVPLAAANFVTARTVAVTVTNPNGQVSASKPFVVRANPSSPHPRIVSARFVRSAPPPPNPGYIIAATQIIVSIGAPRAAGTSLSVEVQKAGSTAWTVVNQVNLTQSNGTMNEEIAASLPVDDVIAGDSARVRLLNSAVSTQYSNVFLLQVTP